VLLSDIKMCKTANNGLQSVM